MSFFSRLAGIVAVIFMFLAAGANAQSIGVDEYWESAVKVSCKDLPAGAHKVVFRYFENHEWLKMNGANHLYYDGECQQSFYPKDLNGDGIDEYFFYILGFDMAFDYAVVGETADGWGIIAQPGYGYIQSLGPGKTGGYLDIHFEYDFIDENDAVFSWNGTKYVEGEFHSTPEMEAEHNRIRLVNLPTFSRHQFPQQILNTLKQSTDEEFLTGATGVEIDINQDGMNDIITTVQEPEVDLQTIFVNTSGGWKKIYEIWGIESFGPTSTNGFLDTYGNYFTMDCGGEYAFKLQWSGAKYIPDIEYGIERFINKWENTLVDKEMWAYSCFYSFGEIDYYGRKYQNQELRDYLIRVTKNTVYKNKTVSNIDIRKKGSAQYEVFFDEEFVHDKYKPNGVFDTTIHGKVRKQLLVESSDGLVFYINRENDVKTYWIEKK